MVRRIVFLLLAIAVLTAVSLSVYAVTRGKGADQDKPWDFMAKKTSKTDHSNLYKVEQFENGPDVTKACLSCHAEAAQQVMRTSHWNWVGDEEMVPGHSEPMRIGKKNLINNFCIGIEGNWLKCTNCHAGYGWKDETFDFSLEENVDCLVCHDQSGGYAKGTAGLPAEGVDLIAAAKSVGRPTRDNCGYCHFNGGGGDAVKHGDLDGSLAKPVERVDVHMGRHDFQCIECHRTEKHEVAGRMISVSATDTIKVNCVDCHSPTPHRINRLNEHTDSLACQTCHIPAMALKEPTKVAWDWSTAGQDVDVDDSHKYLKIKGSFIYAKEVAPEYYWFNGNSARYLKGDKIDPDEITHINYPQGDIYDPQAKIWPFKVHRAKQPYDVRYRYLIVPKTVGEGGYWTDFDWKQAAELGSRASGLAFSGELGFAETEMFWTQTHMVVPKEHALQCVSCHGEEGRMNWTALGYDTDPALTGGREQRRFISPAERRAK